MANKLEGYSRVAVIEYSEHYQYYFAIYDDGIDYKVGDKVFLSGRSDPGKIVEIISTVEAEKRCSKDITGEVICKLDTSAYDRRVELRHKQTVLKRALAKRKREIQGEVDDEFYASKDEKYAELLKEYREVSK